MRRAESHRICKRRHTVEAALVSVANSVPDAGLRDTVLIDAMWDNPNYWLRLTTVRAALGSCHAREIGMIGTHRQREVAQTLSNLSIGETIHWSSFTPDRRHAQETAEILCQSTNTPADILSWELPGRFPAELVYDGILKRQRLACVDHRAGDFRALVEDALLAIETAERIISSVRPNHVILSHALNFDFGALAWVAAREEIKTTLIFGMFGGARFVKITGEDDLFDLMDFPDGDTLDSLTPSASQTFADQGRIRIEERFCGETNDIGAQLAFQSYTTSVSQNRIREDMGWSNSGPIVAVYAANWFDYPHNFGMRNFRDFLDWLEVTIDAARRNTDVNWLFKAHPCDEWYGGVTLSDLIGDQYAPNIGLVPDCWNSAELLASIDGLVTVHSTGALEAAALGKPVLVADRGWYHKCGFVHWAQTREDYLRAVATDWWAAVDTAITTQRAQTFAGIYFGRPEWQRDFITDDDSNQDKIYDSMMTMIEAHTDVIAREVSTLRDWFSAPHRRYHTFKMLRESNAPGP